MYGVCEKSYTAYSSSIRLPYLQRMEGSSLRDITVHLVNKTFPENHFVLKQGLPANCRRSHLKDA